jgi:hypothetical protein
VSARGEKERGTRGLARLGRAAGPGEGEEGAGEDWATREKSWAAQWGGKKRRPG